MYTTYSWWKHRSSSFWYLKLLSYKIQNQNAAHYAKIGTLNKFLFQLASGVFISHIILAFYNKNPVKKLKK